MKKYPNARQNSSDQTIDGEGDIPLMNQPWYNGNDPFPDVFDIRQTGSEVTCKCCITFEKQHCYWHRKQIGLGEFCWKKRPKPSKNLEQRQKNRQDKHREKEAKKTRTTV